MTTGKVVYPKWIPPEEYAWAQSEATITIVQYPPIADKVPTVDKKFQDHFLNCFPPESTPAFIIDMGVDYQDFIPDSKDPKKVVKRLDDLKWRVRLLQTIVTDGPSARELVAHGWGALSYAWGEYMTDQTKRDVWRGDRMANKLPLAVGDSYDATARSIYPKNDYDWLVPKCDKLKIDDIKRVCLSLGKRFVWWDWACIPQQDLSDGYRDLRPPTVPKDPPALPAVVGDMKNGEVGKQKFVYQKAAVGGVWLHTMDWNDPDASKVSPIKTLLSMAPPALDFTTLKGLFQDGTEATAKRTLEKVLEESLLKGATGIRDALENLKTILTAIRPLRPPRGELKPGEFIPGDGWFRSLWSFQEGRLMKDPILFDKNAKTLPMLNVDTLTYAANFIHLCAIPTFLASQISLAIATRDQLVSQAVFKQSDKVSPKLVDLAKTDRAYLLDYLRYLTSSGLVADPGDAPLQLLAAARRSRFPSLFMPDNYYAMIGVLDIFDKVKMESATAADAYSLDLEIIQRNFFEALIARHQWKMLLLAKFTVDPVSSWRAVSLGHFEPIEPFFQAFLGQLIDSKMQQQSLAQPLPLLTYDKVADEVVIRPAADKKTLTIWKWVLPANFKSSDDFRIDKIQNISYSLMGANFQKYLDEGWVDIDVNPKTTSILPKLSKPVTGQSAQSYANPDKMLMIPIQDFGFLFSAPADKATAAAPAAPSTSGRCLVLDGVTGSNGVFKASFKYIMDISNAPITVADATEVRVKWQ